MKKVSELQMMLFLRGHDYYARHFLNGVIHYHDSLNDELLATCCSIKKEYFIKDSIIPFP